MIRQSSFFHQFVGLFLTASASSIMIIIKILENEENAMANPTMVIKRECDLPAPRYGVYAVIPDGEKQIVLVQAPNGAWFLPVERLKQARSRSTERGLIEELGFTAEIGIYYGQADSIFYSRHRDT